MKLNVEEQLTDAIELSPELAAFMGASWSLASRIERDAKRLGYDLERACSLVADGHIRVAVLMERPGSGFGLAGLPAPVALFLQSEACGGIFPPSEPAAAEAAE